MSAYQPYTPPTATTGTETPNAYGQVPGQGVQPYPNMPYPGGNAMVRPEHPQATAVLILGILGFFVSITGPIAWFMGNKAKKECEAGMYTMNDQLKIGRILGMVVTILLIVGIVISILLVIIFVILAAASGY